MVNKKMNAVKVRCGCVLVSDGKRRPQPVRLSLTQEFLKLQKEQPENNYIKIAPVDTKERKVTVTRRRDTGLGISIKGGLEHKLPIMISRIYPRQAAHETGQLFVGDAIIKVNNQWLTSCSHDEALEILKNAGEKVTIYVKHYPAASPFLQHTLSRDNFINDAGDVRIEEYTEQQEAEMLKRKGVEYIDVVTVPLMMAYVTRYIFGTDKLRPNAFEVRGLNGSSTGVIHCADVATSSQWLKFITDNIIGLTRLQIKLYNRNLSQPEKIEYMGWVNEGISTGNLPWLTYKPRFFTLKGTDVLIFDSPPLNVVDWLQCDLIFKVYQIMFRVLKDSEQKDARQHCFLIQACGQPSRYLSVETRQELLRIESAWHSAVCSAVIQIGAMSYPVKWAGQQCILSLDWQLGFILRDQDGRSIWSYKFSQLKGSSDDGKNDPVVDNYPKTFTAGVVGILVLHCRLYPIPSEAILCGRDVTVNCQLGTTDMTSHTSLESMQYVDSPVFAVYPSFN